MSLHTLESITALLPLPLPSWAIDAALRDTLVTPSTNGVARRACDDLPGADDLLTGVDLAAYHALAILFALTHGRRATSGRTGTGAPVRGDLPDTLVAMLVCAHDDAAVTVRKAIDDGISSARTRGMTDAWITLPGAPDMITAGRRPDRVEPWLTALSYVDLLGLDAEVDGRSGDLHVRGLVPETMRPRGRSVTG